MPRHADRDTNGRRGSLASWVGAACGEVKGRQAHAVGRPDYRRQAAQLIAVRWGPRAPVMSHHRGPLHLGSPRVGVTPHPCVRRPPALGHLQLPCIAMQEDLETPANLDDRLATLAHRHRSPGVRQAEQAAEQAVCGVPGCGRQPARLLPRGHRCVSVHLPAQPVPGPVRISTSEQPRAYGAATSDPLGRPGWNRQARLPSWTAAADDA